MADSKGLPDFGYPLPNMEDEARERLDQKLMLVRILIGLLLVVDALVIGVFANGKWGIIFAALLLFAIATTGMCGAIRRSINLLKVYWIFLYIWTGAFVFGMVLFLTLPSATVQPIAAERCKSNAAFAATFSTNCTIQDCIARCVVVVKRHLNIEAIAFTTIVALILVTFGTQARRLCKELSDPAVKAQLVHPNQRVQVVDDEDEEELASQQHSGRMDASRGSGAIGEEIEVQQFSAGSRPHSLGGDELRMRGRGGGGGDKLEPIHDNDDEDVDPWKARGKAH